LHSTKIIVKSKPETNTLLHQSNATGSYYDILYRHHVRHETSHSTNADQIQG